MDKDVKRALILWPTIASTAVVAATTLPVWWNTNSAQDALRSAAAGTSPLARVVGLAQQWMPAGIDTNPQPQSITALLSEDLATSTLARSLRDTTATPRPDHGRRGVALPQRLAGNSASVNDSAAEPGGAGEDGRSTNATSQTADLAASSQVIARTLLAPVLDPVAELAGYSGLTLPSPLALPQDAVPPATWALPSILAPGMDDPFSATGCLTSAWKTSLDPLASLQASAAGESKERKDEESQPLIPRSVEVLAKPSPQPNRAQSRVRASGARVTAHAGNPVTWPRPKQLCQDLAMIAADATAAQLLPRTDRLASLTSVFPADEGVQSLAVTGTPMQRQATSILMGRWADKADRTLAELRSLPRIGDDRSGELIRELAAMSEAGLQLAERVPARDQQVRWLRASHALSRRAAVWGPIWQLARQSGDHNLSSASQDVTSVPGGSLVGEAHGYSLVRFPTEAPEPSTHVPTLVAQLRAELTPTGDDKGWIKFLLLDEIERAAVSEDADSRALLGLRFLSRLDHHSLQGEQRQWLRRDSVRALASAMQTWTAQPIDYARLLDDLERGETDSIDLAAIKVSEAFQSLRYSDDADAARIAKAIDVTYRNANVRTAISIDLINRLLPPVPTRSEPIRTTLLGNAVRGTSTVDSHLGLSLTPSPDSWNLALTTNGNVSTRSSSGQSGVTVTSQGENVFHATTPLLIRPDGYRIGTTQVDVRGQQQLSGIRSRYDGWPLVGSLVRGIAEARFADAQPIAERVSNERIRSQVSEELQSQLSAQTAAAELRLDEFVLGPLGRLSLDPKVIELKTTPQRLVARYRLAGDWQLASNTPRPRAWSDSWMSLQIHQSALNNTMERLLPTGESKSIAQFYHDTMELFGREAQELPEDIPADATIEFAATRPVTIEIDEDKMWLTIRVVSLSQPEGASLRRFIVRAAYRPEVDGLQARLVRDGHLSISGPGMSMRQRIPLRALFNKILSENRSIPLTPPRLIEHAAADGLAVSQLELRDGWLALAISPETSPRVAAAARPAVVQ